MRRSDRNDNTSPWVWAKSRTTYDLMRHDPNINPTRFCGYYNFDADLNWAGECGWLFPRYICELGPV